MHPLYIIARREFLQRVRQKSFWVMLLLGPFFLLLVMVVPIGLAMEKESSSEILFLDESKELEDFLYSEPDLALVKVSGTVAENFKKAKKGGYAGLLWIGKESGEWQVRYYPSGLSGPQQELIREVVKRRITEYELTGKQNIDLPDVNFRVATIAEIDKSEPDNAVGFAIGLFAAVIILVFINQYSHMVLRGVVEEKQNRISELILTSIKPIYFISGKILGIASVAFLQIFIWCLLSGTITFGVQKYFKLERFSDNNLADTLKTAKDVSQTLEMNNLLNSISTIDAGMLFLGFIFYFVCGYLLYSVLFAIVGISAGSDTDAQQMAIPFTLPLSLPVILLQYITDNQDSSLTFFLSVFPFTSPTAMLLRLPHGVPTSELLISATVLVLTLVLAAFAAAKIYRIGIFMYGKKLNLSELVRAARNS